MGYLLTSLEHVPRDGSVKYLVYLLHNPLLPSDDPDNKVVDRLFPYFASRVGEQAAVVIGTEYEAWDEEVCRWYLRKEVDQFADVLPGLLLTDSHPLDCNEDTFRLLVPLRKAEERFQGMALFNRSLLQFVQGKNDKFVEHFQSADDFVDRVLKYTDLTIGQFGFGIKVGNMVRNAIKAREKDHLLRD